MGYSEKTADEMERQRPALQVSHLDVFYKKRKGSFLKKAAKKQALYDVSFDLHAENRPDNIMTEYERKFSGFGEKINRCEVTFR